MSNPRRRKRHLGPDSIESVPTSPKARLTKLDKEYEYEPSSCDDEVVRSDKMGGHSSQSGQLLHPSTPHDSEDEQADHQCSSTSVTNSEHSKPTNAPESVMCYDEAEHEHACSQNCPSTDSVEDQECLQQPTAQDICNFSDLPEDEPYFQPSCSSTSSSSRRSSSSSERSLSLDEDFYDSNEEEDQHDNIYQGEKCDAHDIPDDGASFHNPANDDFGGQADPPYQGDEIAEDLPGKQSHAKLREAMLGGYLNPIETPLTASRNDMLYMSLSLAGRNKDSNNSFFNMINLLNCSFGTPILPDTKYLMDNLLVSEIGVNYYRYCEECFNYFRKLDYKTVKFKICENCQTRNQVSDLRRAAFFVIYYIPVQLEILFSSKPELFGSLVPPAEACKIYPDRVCSDICSGSMYKKMAEETSHFKEMVLTFHFFIDGAPVAPSSNSSIWPIQLALNELPAHERMKNLLLGGLWFGKTQPPMDLFLTPFVAHMRDLAEGFQLRINNQLHPARCYCIGCSADSGARGLVQGIASHGGYFSCNWCKIKGQYIAGAVRYPFSNEAPENQTHGEIVTIQSGLFNILNEDSEDDSEQHEEEEDADSRQPELYGIKKVSPLINLPKFDMVNGFLFESMHCIDLGIVRAFFALWLEESQQDYYIKQSVPEINRRIKALRVPLEFRRMPRTFKERLKFKSREYNNMIFTSYAILKGILPDRYLNSWLLFVQAYCFLHQTRATLDQINKAKDLINHFLTQTQTLYGRKHMSFNLHIFKHAIDHASRWGLPWATSAYAFESGNGQVKSMVHSAQGIPQQVTRSYSWEMAKKILEPLVSERARNYVSNILKPKSHHKLSTLTGMGRLIGKPKEFKLSIEEKYLFDQNNHGIENVQSYQKLIYNHCAYVIDSKKCARTSNSIAKLEDKSVVLIRRIFYDTDRDEIFILGSTVNWDPILTLPAGLRLESRDEHFLRNVTYIDDELRYIRGSHLQIICFRTKLTHIDLLVPLPNIYNRF